MSMHSYYNAYISHLRNDKLVAFQDGSYLMDQEFDGKGLTPYDPAHNSTYLLAGKENLENIQNFLHNLFKMESFTLPQSLTSQALTH